MKYDKRNLDNLSKLAPNTRFKATEWYEYCKQIGFEILIYETIRTEQTQRQYVAKGVSKTMKSYHIVGQALDFVPIVNGQTSWAMAAYQTPLAKKAVQKAKDLGFEWGGDWKSFVDAPHLQYEYKGYGTDKVLTYKKPAPKKVVAGVSTEKPVVKKEEVKVADVKLPNVPSEWAKANWEEATRNGYFDGNRPQENITRQELAVVVNRLRNNFLVLINDQGSNIDDLKKRLEKIEQM